MTALLFGHEQSVAEWVGRKNGKAFEPPYSAFGVLDNEGTLVGGFVFTGFNGDAIEMSLAGPGCITRGAWRAVLDYVFRQRGCTRLQVHTSRRNKRMKKIVARGAFHFEGIARRFYGKDDAVVYSLIADDLPNFRERWKL